jgi:hypothetical protein
MSGSLLTFDHIAGALVVAVLVGLRGALAVIRVRKRRLEKLRQRLEQQDGK